MSLGSQPSENSPFPIYEASKLVDAVLHSKDNDLIQLSCGDLNATRYNYLKPAVVRGVPSRPRYFFALDLHQSAEILPRLLSSIVEAMYFLGPENCILSITEGRSTDGTLEALTALKPVMEKLGVIYILEQSDLNPLGGDADRVQALAELRNQALNPLVDRPQAFEPNTVVIFINDVSLCVEDILELLHQRVYQSADMTCAMDWINDGSLFYDVWIGRQMNGDSFFEIPQSGSWEFAANLFWNDPSTRARLDHGQPIQVFSCWNGATTFTAKPVMEQKIKFRSAHHGECRLGEPTHFCKDMWKEGYKKIAIVPTVNIGYSDEQSRLAKERHGSVSSWVEKENSAESFIFWDKEPPRKIKCFPSWDSPSMVRWDQ
jgi:alpha-1,3-mannosyltransferase